MKRAFQLGRRSTPKSPAETPGELIVNGVLLPRVPARSRATAADRSKAGPSELPWRVVSVVGWVLAIIGVTDALLLWYPLNLGNPEWEFATIGATLDALPLTTIGLAAVTIAALANGSRRTLRLVGGALLFAALGVAVIYCLYLLSAAVAWKALAPEFRFLFFRAVLKSSVLGVMYVGLYGWLARGALRGARSA